MIIFEIFLIFMTYEDVTPKASHPLIIQAAEKIENRK